MFTTLLLLAGVLEVVETFVAHSATMVEGDSYRHSTVQSDVVLTPEEQKAWDDDLSADARVAIFRRGLMRQEAVEAERSPSHGRGR